MWPLHKFPNFFTLEPPFPVPATCRLPGPGSPICLYLFTWGLTPPPPPPGCVGKRAVVLWLKVPFGYYNQSTVICAYFGLIVWNVSHVIQHSVHKSTQGKLVLHDERRETLCDYLIHLPTSFKLHWNLWLRHDNPISFVFDENVLNTKYV